jgi:hypothetical protein
MAIPTRQPQGIPTGGQFAPDTRTEPTITLSPAADKIHTAVLRKTIQLRNADFDQLPTWPGGMPEPTVSFDFSDGKCETNITVDDKMMCFWDSDSDGTINDTDNGNNPWEDFDEEDQEMALEWGKRVHQRIDSSTYGIMNEASNTPAVHSIILAHALGKEPAPAPAAPDLTDQAVRSAYVIGAAARLSKAERELQQVYMIGAAQEIRETFPEIDSFELNVDGKHLGLEAAWDADGNEVSSETLFAAGYEVFRTRDEDDFSTFLDGQRVTVQDAIAFRPAG